MVDELTQWYQQPAGIALAATIKQRIQLYLPRLFGYYLVELGSQWLGRCPIRYRYCYTDVLSVSSNVCGSYQQSPFATASVDVVFLPHILEFSHDWQAVVQEVERILIPGGQVLILGFNAYSLWRLWGVGKSLGQHQLNRGLVAAGFKVKHREHFFFRPPIHNTGYLQKLVFLERLGECISCYPGAVYLLLAQKNDAGSEVITMKKRRVRSYGAVAS